MEEVGCVLCVGACTCSNELSDVASADIIHSDAESEKSLVESESEVEVEKDQESEQEPEIDSQVDFERDRFWVDESDAQTLSESSVYEEPSDDDSDEDIMVEIVRDRLLNGWTSEEDEEEDLVFEDFFHVDSVGVEVLDPQSLQVVEPEPEPEVEIKEEFIEPEPEPEPEIKKPIPITPKVLKIEEKRASQSTLFNSRVEKTPKTPLSTPKNTNPWLALAAMNKSTSSSPFPQGTFAAIQESPSISNLFKKSMATTAKALLSSPSTLKAFSDIKKVDTINLQAKIKKAAQAAAKGVEEKVVFVNKNMFSSSSMTKAVQELGKLLGDDNDDFLLIEDILDEDLIDDTAISPVSDTENSQFERLRKVPLGTFWNSQRSRKGSKRNLQRAIKGTFDNKILDSTLLETLPTKKRRKSVSVFSPMLVAVDSREGVHTFQVDDIPSYLIPPPLNLN